MSMKKREMKLFAVCAVAVGLLFSAGQANAAIFTVTSQLTGDLRLDAPDDLIVDVTINVVDDVASWIVDINSPVHPDIKLDEFYFNVVAGTYTFSNFNPTGWAIEDPATVQGLGGVSFMFAAQDPPGPPNADDVTNLQNLTFDMTKTTGNWLLTDFTGADTTCSNDISTWCGQLGAHLQSLLGGESGFALGIYESDVTPTDDSQQTGGTGVVPEPTSLVLLGTGLLVAGYLRRRKS